MMAAASKQMSHVYLEPFRTDYLVIDTFYTGAV